MSFRPLHPLLQEKSQKEANEDPNRIDLDVYALREWIEKEPHLKSVNPSDQWILSFLRGNKFSLEITKARLDMCYTLRTVAPEIFHNRYPFDSVIQTILKLGFFLPLTVCKSEDSCRICILRFVNLDLSKHTFNDIIKICLMIIEILILEDDNFIIAGLDALVDLSTVDISVICRWPPSLSKKCVTILQKALPVRLKSSHVFNVSSGLDAAFVLLNNILGEKLMKRIHVYNNSFEAMYDVIPRDILPKEYGGERGTVQELTDYWKKKVESYSEWFLREELACSDESLRPDKPNTSSSIFGIEGSFRKLQLD